jgi:nucleoside-diphosphate-sugar epimerase
MMSAAGQSGVLVVGCGYLGRRVAERWRAEGRRVFATTRRPERAAELAERGLEPVVCDVLRPDSLRALPAADTVVYCVGLDRAAGVPMRVVYVDGLANVLGELAGRQGGAPGRFVYVSSTGVYGQADGSEVAETAATEPAEESGRVVLEAERLLRERLREAVVLRFAGIYGPGRLLRSQALRAREAIAADPEGWLNLIHVEDGAAAVVAAAERGRPGAVYNICDDRPVRRRDFYAQLARLLGAPPPCFAPPPPHEWVNRRVVNRRLREELGMALRYPSYEEGLPMSV